MSDTHYGWDPTPTNPTDAIAQAQQALKAAREARQGPPPDLFTPTVTPTRPNPGTRAEAVLVALEQGGWLCSHAFYLDHRRPGTGLTHRIAARILDLKKAGWPITTRQCQTHDHDSNATEYHLEETQP